MRPRFDPWVPDGDPRFMGIRLLVLGESHYEEEGWIDDGRDLPGDYTQTLVQEWGLNPPHRQPFYAGVYSVLTGEPWENDTEKLASFWNSVMTYNYVQRLVPGGPNSDVPKGHWTFSEPMFRAMLESLRPEAILITGRRLWRNMASEDVVLAEAEVVTDTRVGYRLKDGTSVPAIHINHPSDQGFDWRTFHPSVRRFLEDTGATYPD